MTYKLSNNPFVTAATMPPFAKMNQVFTNEEIDRMCDYFTSKGTKSGQIGKTGGDTTDIELRKSGIRMHEYTPETSWFFERLNNAIYDGNSHFFRFNVVGYDYLQYTEYKAPDERYGYHTDMPYGANHSLEKHLMRKLSFSLILSDPADYVGGEFEFMIESDKPWAIPQARGDLIIFPSWLLHEVKPVTQGIRKSLVGWVLGPKFV
jgi:PKHD-type hydroxylase